MQNDAPVKLKMNKNSLFAILMRSPWWVSVLAAFGVFAVTRLVLGSEYAFYSAAIALPLAVIAVVAAWQQFRTPSGERVETALERLRALPWEGFAAALEEGFRGEGYTIRRLNGSIEGAADFELEKAGRILLVAAKRWKASRTGVEPLRELQTAGATRESAECIFLSAAELSANARGFAAEKKIRIIEGLELLKLADPAFR